MVFTLKEIYDPFEETRITAMKEFKFRSFRIADNEFYESGKDLKLLVMLF